MTVYTVYNTQLSGREKMAAAGSRHVTEPCGEVNDGLAVIPRAEMEIEALSPVLQDSIVRIPIIGLSSPFRVFIRGNAYCNMHMCLAVGLLLLHVCRGDNYPFMRPQCPRMESPLC
ncbi:unnamed protein product [Pleuronectes platessa]|uniref:Uncharacterized protein n=1 Tax=Pleuronectes platessa TaxID=8262 RepID=A0A9N7V1F8_PLEPL|nr:unnamed protein product [Pleuronectes platessa]